MPTMNATHTVTWRSKTLCQVFMHEEAKKYLAIIGAKGGKAGTGKAKARTKAQARKAANARWAKRPNAELSEPPTKKL